jgi:mono/diheme cytochrome c family protein
MTRESRARWLALATAAVVVALAALFSFLRNPPASAPAGASAAPAAPAADPARLAAGQQAFERLGCGSCHSVGGRGNPSSPLDGVGARLDSAAILEFTTGTGTARESLGAGLARRKARALDDPELDVLVEYLAQLR